MVLTRIDGRWTLIDEDGVTTLDAPVRLPVGQRVGCVTFLARVMVSIAWRGHP
jgi:hypothetical protein